MTEFLPRTSTKQGVTYVLAKWTSNEEPESDEESEEYSWIPVDRIGPGLKLAKLTVQPAL